jgi:hypothetical protein
LIGDGADPIGEAEDFLNDDDDGGFVLALVVDDPGFHFLLRDGDVYI